MNAVDVKGLSVRFPGRSGDITVVDDISFEIAPGKILGIVGESGSGKSMTALALLGLLPEGGIVTAEKLSLLGNDVLEMSEGELRRFRGRRTGFIFQDPTSALNPIMPVGRQIAERIVEHESVSWKEAMQRAERLLDRVGIPDVKRNIAAYPHQFSGGMRQRVVIAIGIACNPGILIADEPTTALDVTVQAQILSLIHELADEYNAAVALITHDLDVAAEVCDEIAVMYAGKIVERGTVADIFLSPGMPYTRGLLDSRAGTGSEPGAHLRAIAGLPPDLTRHVPSGCRFAARCRFARPLCEERSPALTVRDDKGHAVACWGTEADGWIR